MGNIVNVIQTLRGMMIEQKPLHEGDFPGPKQAARQHSLAGAPSPLSVLQIPWSVFRAKASFARSLKNSRHSPSTGFGGQPSGGPENAQREGQLNDITGSPKLRVFFVTEDDPLYVIRFFDTFFAEYPRDEFEICGMTIDLAFHETFRNTLRRMHAFYGVWGFIRQGLRFVNARLRNFSIPSLASSLKIPVIATGSVNCPPYIARLRAIRPDVIVSVAATEIFKAELLSVPRLGCINIHSGRLPTYRGMMPTFWQMLRGETAITITVHHMAERLDAGDVMATRLFPIKAHDCLDRVIRETKCEGARLMIDVLRDLRAGRTSRRQLDMTQASYFSFPRPKDVREFRKCGHTML